MLHCFVLNDHRKPCPRISVQNLCLPNLAINDLFHCAQLHTFIYKCVYLFTLKILNGNDSAHKCPVCLTSLLVGNEDS